MTIVHADNGLTHWSRDYWLAHCEGFRVEDDARRLGIVEEVIGDEDEPAELVVRGGLFANRVYRIPAEAVVEVDPRAERILVRMYRS